MALCREDIEKGEIRKYFGKPKAGEHKWRKNQMNRLIRRQKIDEDDSTKFKRPTKYWEF